MMLFQLAMGMTESKYILSFLRFFVVLLISFQCLFEVSLRLCEDYDIVSIGYVYELVSMNESKNLMRSF